jgi:hypothetical protein
LGFNLGYGINSHLGYGNLGYGIKGLEGFGMYRRALVRMVLTFARPACGVLGFGFWVLGFWILGLGFGVCVLGLVSGV